MAIVDVTIRGAGVFGLTAALACVQRGAKVRVVDPFGVGAGSSGGLVGALAPHVPENWNPKKAFQFSVLSTADQYWSRVAMLAGQDVGYARTGRLQPLADDRAVDLARARAAGAAQFWGDQFDWRVVDAQGDWVPLSPTGLLVHDTLTARIHPRKATAALAKAVTALGAEVVDEAADEGAVIWATGAKGLLDLSSELKRAVGNGVKGQAALLAFDARDKPQLFADGLHIVPHADGTVAIGSTSERLFSHEKVDDQLEDVIDRARAAFPVLRSAKIIERWAGIRPRAKSRAPMLGKHPLKEGHFVMNGGFKIGFGMAPKLGEVMADLVLDGVNTIPDGFEVEASL
ncbi:FAD-binding oxidoreductase [Nereida sp. MMG025]|uniref:NAD(P)/FAD-dependent oxidoreductase n=1 Tax=Nereida sp. MMG025 TaxID=2909981 RepID=UPI001F1B8B70|nr:FAD-binding oxidoreductase [Nereida sp. MMG025]MCF6444890.1 FAD-binding oxidoreductase [Nereida sp. MMG025]